MPEEESTYIELQITSIAQRHLQVNFEKVQGFKGDGWVLFQFPMLDNCEKLPAEIQKLCVGIVRDITNRTSLRLKGEEDESDFNSIASSSISFMRLISKNSEVASISKDVFEIPDDPNVKGLVDMLYNDVVSDISIGIHAISDFPLTLCPTGSRFDVVMKQKVVVSAFSAKNRSPLNPKSNKEEEKEINMDSSLLLANSTTLNLGADALHAEVLIDTRTFANAISSYSSFQMERTLPSLWRHKSFVVAEGVEVLQHVKEALNNYWSRNPHTERTKINAISLLAIVSHDLSEYIKTQVLHGPDWRSPWRVSLPDLQTALQMIKAWTAMVSSFTKKEWVGWDGGNFQDQGFNNFVSRVSDVVRIRELLMSVNLLLVQGTPPSLQPESIFENESMTDSSKTSDARWAECVNKFEQEFSFYEDNLRGRIRQLFTQQQGAGQIRLLQQYRTILQRPSIKKAVENEMNSIVQYFKKQVDTVRKRYHENKSRSSDPLHLLRAAKSCQAECAVVPESALKVLGTSSYMDEIKDEAQHCFAEAEIDTQAALESWKTLIETESAQLKGISDALTLEFQKNHNYLVCKINPAITKYIQHTRDIRAWCTQENIKAIELSSAAKNILLVANNLFLSYNRLQQATANFNTTLRQIIPCTRVMLSTAIDHALSQILYEKNAKRVVSFSNSQELEGLHLRFQSNVESLSSDNRHIRRFHGNFLNQVVSLHDVDLLKHMDQWRSGVDSMRNSFEDFLQNHRFQNYEDWRRFWDCQIYKALEHQYRKGLDSLNENLEELKAELVYKQGTVQFKPSYEALREAYYIKLREFISVPLRFRGLQPKREGNSLYEIYPMMPKQNTDRIAGVHAKALELFSKLNRLRKAFKSHLILGSCGTNDTPDLDTLVETLCRDRQQFVDGFAVVKDRLKKSSMIEDHTKIEGFSVSNLPIKATLEDQLHRLEESILNTMRKMMLQQITEVDDFVFSASNVIERQPTTMDEVGKANKAYREYLESLPVFEEKFKGVEEMNKELRRQSGAAIEINATKSRLDHLREAMASHHKVMDAAVSKMSLSLNTLIQKYLKDIQRFANNWTKQRNILFQAFKDKKTDQIAKGLNSLKDLLNDLNDLRSQGVELNAKCDYFSQPKPNLASFEETSADVERTATMWGLYDSFNEKLDVLRKEEWLTFRSHTGEFEDFVTLWKTTLEKEIKKDKAIENVIANYLLGLLREWSKVIPLLKYVRGDGMMTEHWNAMFRLLEMDKGMTSLTLTFGDILSHYKQIITKEDEVKKLHSRAQGEVKIREALQDVRTWALEATLTLVSPSESSGLSLGSKIKLITEWKAKMTEVSDNQALISSLVDSPFFVHFADEINGWDAKFVALSESLGLLRSIQERWIYLEPIFSRGAMPQEQARFKRVDKEFVAILREIEADPKVMSIASQVDSNEKLKGLSEQMERCQKSLLEYLNTKRDKFPRFYFISDDDLLEILGQSQNPTVIQSHLKKLFMGINSVIFNEEKTAITHMVSANQEEVKLINPVPITQKDVEDWLIMLDDYMKETLQALLVENLKHSDPLAIDCIKSFPSQILQVANQVTLAKLAENAIQNQSINKLLESLQKKLNYLTSIAFELDPVNVAKVKALILDTIHDIGVLELLVEKRVSKTSEWWWQKQLRYYMDSNAMCIVKMVDASFQYTYEYQGSAPKLVHTPLTDKCYLIMTKGMNLGYGGNPYGPAGTGKTESVKALGAAMGRQVLVFNCDEGIDFKAMGRIFVGIVKCGAWGCFDEFNRLKIDQLSAISQMIQIIQETLKNGEKECTLLNRNVSVNRNTGIFVTLNPAGKDYGGRTKLPDNLKQLFREICMVHPDNEFIVSTILFSEGFSNAKSIAKKVVELFKLCSQLMSRQKHYDWGLRPLTAVIRLGGSLLQRLKSESPDTKIEKEQESQLILQSLNINISSKLTLTDAQMFQEVISCIFPKVTPLNVARKDLEEAVSRAITDLELQLNQHQVEKVFQLYEAMNSRMGVVLVGPSGSGKSTLIRILRKALQSLGMEIPLHAMNPKAMPRKQLLGYMDADTREWFDGVLSAAAREVVKMPQDVRSWILCDGDIDPEWVESLNSVLDDNKLLTMPNGVRIQFGSNVNFLFETHSLEYASPATVSRMGVIFFTGEEITMDDTTKSFITQLDPKLQTLVEPFLHKYLIPAVEEALKMDSLSVPTTRMGLLKTTLNYITDVENEVDFIFTLARGLGAALDPESAMKLAQKIYEMSGQRPVNASKPLDTIYDRKTKALAELQTALNDNISLTGFHSGDVPLVKIIEIQRLLTTLQPLINDPQCHPFFLVGPEGCGKKMVLSNAFTINPNIRTTVINCNSQTTSQHVIQKLEQLCILYSTNTFRMYRPKEGERLVLILRDINLPKPDKYGTVELHSFIQQLILYKGFYNKDLEWIGVDRIQIVGSLNPTISAGRYPVTPRLLAVVNIITMTYPSKESLQQIYSTYWASLLKETGLGQGKNYNNGTDLAQLMTNIYDRIRRRFEGEEYAHCLFCPRSITKWIANTLLYDITAQNPLPAVLTYEAGRIFADCLPKPEDRHKADKILAEMMASIGYSVPQRENRYSTMYVSWFMEPDPEAEAGKSTFKKLQLRPYEEIVSEVERALLKYSREYKDLAMPVIPEIVVWVTRVDRVLSRPSGNLLLVGRPGVGRRNAVVLAAYILKMDVVILNMSHDYNFKMFRSDIRNFVQRATVQNEKIVLLLEDHNILHESFLEVINGLVTSGEVPGLFSTEEMEIMYSTLRDEASNEGFLGNIYHFFLNRLKVNLRVVLIMDYEHKLFSVRLQSNPGLLSDCDLLWMGSWSSDMAKSICKVTQKNLITSLEADPENKGFSVHREIVAVHESLPVTKATPKRLQVLMATFQKLMTQKSKSNEEKIARLETGLAKLVATEEDVAKIQQKIKKQKEEIEVKQSDAEISLNEIQKSMENSKDKRDKAKELEGLLKEDHTQILMKRGSVETELESVKPILEAAKDAVKGIRSEDLAEIGSLKAPSEPIRDALEGVLSLLGGSDLTWNTMRKFLSERGAKDRILNFKMEGVTPSIRNRVSKLIQQKKSSFNPEVIRRASVAAAPMAAWVIATVEYSTILDRISPLTQQLEELEKSQVEGETKLESLRVELKEIDIQVEKLRADFSSKCKEVEKLKEKLGKSENDLVKAVSLLEKLRGEKLRWAKDASEIRENNRVMPRRVLISSAFFTYLSEETEDRRHELMKKWSEKLGVPHVNLTSFMRSESDLIQLKTEGLPADQLSQENAITMLESIQTPLVIDPARQALEWIKVHLKMKNVVVESSSIQDERFAHTLELAVRFGKTLLVTEVSSIEPILYPVLRRDLVAEGAKQVVQVGNKQVDWQDSFRILLFTRNSDIQLESNDAALVTIINFSVTSFGLESQLLGITIKHENPELEKKKDELLKEEEELKLKQNKLEVRLLNELVESHGNLLNNVQLITSLNDVKTQTQFITESLEKSSALHDELNTKREVYRPLARKGAALYLLTKDMEVINRMYQFGLDGFISIFTETLTDHKNETGSLPEKIEKLTISFVRRCFYHISVALLEQDRLIFGLHLLANGFCPHPIPKDQWQAFLGIAAHKAESGTGENPMANIPLPSWAPPLSQGKFNAILSLPSGQEIIQRLQLDDTARWREFMIAADPEARFIAESEKGTNMHIMDQLFAINTFRPDRLGAFSLHLILRCLNLEGIVPSESMEEMIQSTKSTTPLLLVTSRGADPSIEIQEIAERIVGRNRFVQIALGGGQTDEAMQQLRNCASQGHWIFLKNLHLVLDWATTLENELCAMHTPNPDFRLIITTESHDAFPSVLLRMSKKIMTEAPPGMQQNLTRTYLGWGSTFLQSKPRESAQMLFGLAWFHALLQERRMYVPQGWTKYYEFSPADLKSATSVICDAAHTKSKGGQVDWVMLCGVLYDCIYSGRLDSSEDEKILQYLIYRIFTPETLLAGTNTLYQSMRVPSTNVQSDILKLIHESIPTSDTPSIFDLPENADRVVRESDATQYLQALRLFSEKLIASEATGTFEAWRAKLQGTLEVWKGSGLAEIAVSKASHAHGTKGSDLMASFFTSELDLFISLIKDLGVYYDEMHFAAEGLIIPSSSLRSEATELISGRIPSRWLDRMEGPSEAQAWLSLLKHRYDATMSYSRQPFPNSQSIDLTHFLRPQTFLSAIRFATAHQAQGDVVDYSLIASVTGGVASSASRAAITIKGSSICLQGAILSQDGSLAPVTASSPTSARIPCDLSLAWVNLRETKVDLSHFATITIFTNPERTTPVFPLFLSASSQNTQAALTLGGVAGYLLPA